MIWRNFFSVRETLSFFHIVWSNGFTFTEKIFREINFLLSNMHFHEFFHIHMYTQCWNDMILPPRIWQKKTLVLSSVASNFSFDHTFHVFEVEMKCRKKINVCNQFLLQCWLKSIAPTWLWEVNKVNLRLFWSLQCGKTRNSLLQNFPSNWFRVLKFYGKEEDGLTEFFYNTINWFDEKNVQVP